jgi:hypothetical protein
VVAIREHGTGAPEHAVHGASEPGTERLQAPAEGISALGLDDQMRVVSLERVVNEPKVTTLAGKVGRAATGQPALAAGTGQG